jgi:4-hydroxythreonine-4-phosphate dehydrogenase
MRVVLVTWHVPLCEVPQLLGPQMLHRTILAADELTKADGVISPKIGVCGLNPHAGERGLIGEEERDFANRGIRFLPDICAGNLMWWWRFIMIRG